MTTKSNFSKETIEYIRKLSVNDSEVKKKLREETLKHKFGRMQIPPEEGQFLSWIVKLIGAKKALEIGVFTGYSALCVAEALPDDGKLVALDISAEYTEIGKKYWKEAGVDKKIDLRIGPAMSTLNELLKKEDELKSYDFVFIDADKPNYDNYYEAALKLVRKGGVIAIDNVLWRGRVHDETVQDENTNALRKINEKLSNDKRVDFVMIAIADGISLCRVLI